MPFLVFLPTFFVLFSQIFVLFVKVFSLSLSFHTTMYFSLCNLCVRELRWTRPSISNKKNIKRRMRNVFEERKKLIKIFLWVFLYISCHFFHPLLVFLITEIEPADVVEIGTCYVEEKRKRNMKALFIIYFYYFTFFSLLFFLFFYLHEQNKQKRNQKELERFYGGALVVGGNFVLLGI